MNSLTNKYAIKFGSIVFSFILLLIVTFIISSGVTYADNNVENGQDRLITIHDRGVETVVLSKSATIEEALKEVGINVGSKDAVEPALNEKLTASNYQVNIYRARPVIIIDGNIRIKTITPYQTASQIAQSAGIQIFPEDITKIERTDNIVSEGAGLKLTILRAKSFNFTLYGVTSTVRTQGNTIADMLNEKNIKIDTNDHITLALDTVIYEGINVRLWREGKQTVTVAEAVAFDVEKIESVDKEVNYKAVQSAGINGSRNVTYEILIQDGIEVSRQEIASLITTQPVKQVEIVGVKGKYTSPVENEQITWDYLISKGFTRVQTAGIMGNLMQEHGFKTSGDGLAQWIGGRKAKLYQKESPNNIYTQLDFLMEELNGGYMYVQNNIRADSSSDPYNVTKIFQDQFERCNPYYCMLDRRVEYARNILVSH